MTAEGLSDSDLQHPKWENSPGDPGHQPGDNPQLQYSSNSGTPRASMQIFIAYPYRQYPLAEYRAVFGSLEKLFDVKFTFADDRITDLHILRKIEDFIKASHFSVFDITGWNSNVALELGLALGMDKKRFIAINPDVGSRTGVPSDIGGIDRIQFQSLGELRQELHKLLGEILGIKGRTFRARDLPWNPRGRPKPTPEDYVAAFRNIRVQLVPLSDQPNQMLVDLSAQVESRDWKCLNDDNAPWMHIDFLDKNRQMIEIRGSMHWFPLEFRPNQKRWHFQQKVLVSDRWSEIVDARVWTGAGYAQSTTWYKNWYPHMIYARLRQKLASARRRLSGVRPTVE